MKRKILLIAILCILLCGCGEKNNNNSLKEENSTKTTTTTEKKDTTSTTMKIEDKKTTTTTSKSTTTSIKRTTSIVSDPTKVKTTTTTKKTLAKGVYISLKDNQEHPYSYVYKDKATCDKNAQGETPYDEVYPKHPFMFLGCEEIKDLDGNKYWGIYYLSGMGEEYKFYY